VSQLDGCVKDLEYLSEMQRMESPDYKGSNFHIVPVSGLVLSELCRMENECNTVLELWVPSEYVRRDEEQQTALHRAVAQFNVPEINRILNDGLCDVNSKDLKGWTPLHYGSVHQGGLASCLRLLEVKQIDVAFQNDGGNTALHYMAFWQVSDASMQLKYSKMLEQVITLEPRILSARNLKGETPLHNACQYGAAPTVDLLLQHKADPNIQTVYVHLLTHSLTH
jgi:ankyrin repeat protein